MYAWAEKIIECDLSSGKIIVKPTPDEIKYDFLGGRGGNLRYLYNLTGPQTNPLGPENVLIIANGPLCGTLAPASGRYTVTAKSPLTGLLGDANAGGFFGPELKYAGYDHIIVKGKASEPVYLEILDASVNLRSAKDVWGNDVWESTAILREKVKDPEAQVMTIGPAGENLVKFACVISNLTRAAGRCGMGAVMGSKNLKGVVVRGTGGVKIANPEKFEEAVQKTLESLRADPKYESFTKYGTPVLVMRADVQGWFNVYNRKLIGDWEHSENISGESLLKKYIMKKKACFNCSIHCSHFLRVEGGKYRTWSEGPEYETIGSMGSACGIGEIEPILYMSTLVNKLGLDPMTAGQSIAWAMEAYERGILTEKQIGKPLRWGDADAVIDLIRQIAYRKGFGNQLAEGAYNLSKKIGGTEFVQHVKGLEPSVSDPRGKKAYGLGYAVSSRGGDHLRALPTAEYTFTPEQAERMFGTSKAADRFETEGKAKVVIWGEHVAALTDCLGVCKFQSLILFGLDIDLMAELITHASGKTFSTQDLTSIAERVINLERLYLVKHGISRKDDTLPKRMTQEPSTAKGSLGQVVELDKMLDEYYKLRGWDENGIPIPEKLRELGLEETISSMRSMN